MDSALYKIIPDRVLEEATCNICLKYLTVNPIGISSQGESTCGRCSKSLKRSNILSLVEYYGDRPEDFMPFALLGYATSTNYLFPCINRFEGCTTALPYIYLKQHEEMCSSERRNCFLCAFTGIGSQLIEHFKRSHTKNLLTPQSNFSIDVYKNFDRNFLYKTSKRLFLIKLNYIADLKLVMVQIQYLASLKIRKAKLKCSIEICSTHDDSFYTNLSTDVFSLSNNDVNMNFRIDDLKISDLQVVRMSIVILEVS